MMIYEIQGNPIAWQRARRNGNRYFDAQLNQKQMYQDIIRISQASRKAIYSLSEALIVKIEFHIPIPCSWSLKKRLNANNTPCTKQLDLDNLIKFIGDSLNKVLWEDDKFIFDVHARKIYSLEPKTIIFVEVYDGKKLSTIIPY